MSEMLAAALVTFLVAFPAGVLYGQYLYQDVTLEGDECAHVPVGINPNVWVGCQNCGAELTDEDWIEYHGEGVA